MALPSGEQLGHYKIQSLIGRGGMGEVYRALDIKLEREVAVKVLPAALAGDPERLARFEREAKVLAQLNHPGIAAIYGVEDRALVMELVPGPTLADRLKQGAIPAEEAETILLQIAEALEYAHERGVIHRDLKPANIKIDPEDHVKILDFGLAKALTDPSGVTASAADVSNSPTKTVGGTVAGAILGTAAYMAPEQARGKKVDKRADIWAFGVVAWEMLTGERLFQGEDTVQVLSKVLQQPSDLERVPPKFHKLLRRCLDRNPKDRLRDIGEARFLLLERESWAESPASSLPDKTSRALWLLVAALAVIAAGLGYVAFRHSQEEAPRVAKLSVLPPDKGQFVVTGSTFAGPPAVSPDGRRIAFIANVDAKTGLWIRDLDSPNPRLLAGTEGAISPFWSPDSRYVGFGADGKLKKIDISGGPPLTISDAPSLRGGAWNKNDVIVFSPTNSGGLFRVSAAGGTPTPVTELDKSRNENSDRYPCFLPDGRHFLYMGRSGEQEKTVVFVGDLESPAGKQARKQVVAGDTTAVYAAASGNSTGYLLFMREQTLMAQPFNAGKLATTGEAEPIAEQVDHTVNIYGVFGVSQTGVLAYIAGGASSGVQITWFDRSGRPSGTVGRPPGIIQWASLSPDGATVVTDRVDPQAGLSDLWLLDLARGTASRFTFDGSARSPIWSPDGARILFYAAAKNGNNIFVRNANQTGQEKVLGDSSAQRPTDWSRDGRYIITDKPTTGGIWVHPEFGDRKPFAYGHPGFREHGAKLSPDGKWLAYWSDESKRNEIYVVSFPTPEGKFQISTDGGRIPVWSRDGRELYFISEDSKMMAVKINTAGGKFQASVPKPLFDVRMVITPGGPTPNFDVSKDGRFLIPTAGGEVSNVPMTVVLNWQAGLKK